MMPKHIPLVLFVLSTGCSNSNDNSAPIIVDDQPSQVEQVEQSLNIQFSGPDINGSSDLSRASYPVIRDLSRELGFLMSDALGGYLAFQNGEITENEWQAPYACPDGGSVRVKYIGRSVPNAPRQAEFTGCKLQNRTLTGALIRRHSSGSTGGGAYFNHDESFDNFIIESDTKGTLTISGSTSIAQSSSSPGAILDRGICILDGFGREYSGFIILESARIERPDQAGVIAVNELSYKWTVTLRPVCANNHP